MIGPLLVAATVGRHVSTVRVVQEDAVQPFPVFVTVAQYWPALEVVKEAPVEELPVQEYV